MPSCAGTWPEAPPTPELDSIRQQLALGLEQAERSLGDQLSPANLFFQSFVIMLREGLEAILIVGALMTFLVKMGASHRKRDINLGVAAAVGASLVTAFAIETVFHLTPARQEVLEGVTMVVATVVLFYVSYWLLSKMEVVKWNHFVKSKVNDALTSGSSLALASAAFLAVYREGFETVLFYKALFLTGGPGGSSMPIVAGILVGRGGSGGGLRCHQPVRGEASTQAVLRGDQCVPVLHGVRVRRQRRGRAPGRRHALPTTIVSWAPRMPALGIYPTVESLLAQGVLAAPAAGGAGLDVRDRAAPPRRHAVAAATRDSFTDGRILCDDVRPRTCASIRPRPDPFRDYGGLSRFAGPIETVRVSRTMRWSARTRDCRGRAGCWWWMGAARSAARW